MQENQHFHKRICKKIDEVILIWINCPTARVVSVVGPALRFDRRRMIFASSPKQKSTNFQIGR